MRMDTDQQSGIRVHLRSKFTDRKVLFDQAVVPCRDKSTLRIGPGERMLSLTGHRSKA